MIAKSKSLKNAKEDLDPAAALLARGKKALAKRGTTPPAAAVGATGAPDVRDFGGRTLSKVSIAKCVRHPANRHPSEASIASLAESIKAEGLLEPPELRPLGDGTYQIISGETRILALRKLGRGTGEIEAHIRHCDDARALELLAVFNAKRTDLNPIEKAQMIAKLCADPEEGGAGMGREAAAKIYGLETGAAASNLVGLLKLPKCWQDVVASGEFPQTFARELIPYAPAAAALEALFKDYQDDMKSKNDWDRRNWESRSSLEEHVDETIDQYLRPIEKGHELSFDEDLFEGHLPKEAHVYRYARQYERLFELTPELEAKLGIVTLTREEWIKGKKVKKPMRYATNLTVYDKLQIPLIIEKVNKGEKAAANKAAGKETPKDEKKLTPAEQKKLDAERREQLAARIKTWRHNWLKKILADAFGNPERCPEWQAYRFALWLAGNNRLGNSINSDDFLKELLHAKGIHPDCITPISQETIPEVVHKFAAACFSHRDTNPKYTAFETEDLEAFARDLNIDLAAEWLELGKEDLEVFLLLHQGPQLDPLAKEWDIYMKEGSGKKEKIKFILASGKQKPLPKSVPAIAAPKKPGK